MIIVPMKNLEGKFKIRRIESKQKHCMQKCMGHSGGSSKRKVYSAKCLHQIGEPSQFHSISMHVKALERQEKQTKQ